MARSDVAERRSVTKNLKGQKPTLKGKRKSVFSGRHMDNVPEETHVVSVMTHKPWKQWQSSAAKKGDRLLLHPIRKQNRLTAKAKILTWIRQ